MLKNIFALVLTISIPFSLLAGVWQAARYSQIEAGVLNAEKEQYELIALNKRLISAISVLSAPERIEKVATEELDMRKALPDEIVRIELQKGGLGG